MKSIYLFFLITLIGCNKEENVVKPAIQPDVLTGEWYLKSYTNGFSSPPENYGTNEIIWKFSNNNTLNVTINTSLPVNSKIPVLTTSQYNYNLISGNLTFSTKTFPILINLNNLIFDKGSSSDGERIVFVKM